LPVGLILLSLACGESGRQARTPATGTAVDESEVRVAAEQPQIAAVRHTLAVGEQFSCALRAGRVYCWGANRDGVLGVAGDEPRTTPTEVPGLRDVVSIAAARFHAAALHADGTVSCWGGDTFGRVSGIPTEHGRKGPTRVALVRDAVQVALGENHSCALLRDGSVWCWGWNRLGTLGDGNLLEGATEGSGPVRVTGLPPATFIAAFGALSAAVVDGHVYFWGAGDYRVTNAGGSGGLPRAPVTAEEALARRFEGLSGVERVALHRHHGFALTADGRVLALGIAPPVYESDAGAAAPTGGRPTPRSPFDWEVAPVAGLGPVRQVATGTGHACALLTDGTVRCWGADPSMTGAGIRGDGQHGYRLPPSTLSLGADEVAGGADHLLARAGDTIHAWGSGWAGQLGQGSTESVASPVAVRFASSRDDEL
ncbi:MAG: hypothetical protein KC593_21285, partial [Myxococcales bacterium]|nr:hypothetical protein [Myxococcales bacterium]